MRNKLAAVLCALLPLFGCTTDVLKARSSDTWFAFEQQSEAYGYKDKTGKVMVEPIACLTAPPGRFDDIVAVNGEQGFYYLTKAGKKIVLAPYIFDNAPDCENEGTIRFTDGDNVGLLNKHGDIAIPAQYSGMTRAMNGMVVVRKGGTRVYSPGPDGHYGYTGGELVLLNTHGKTLVENLGKWNNSERWAFYDIREGKLDFYSLRISPEPNSDSDRVNFKAVDGQYYSFVDIEREFNGWLNNLIKDFDQNKLARVTGANVNVTLRGKAGDKTLSLSPVEFVTTYYDAIAAIFLRKDYSVRRDDPVMDVYRDNCGNSMGWRFPAMVVYTGSPQNQLVFQRTERGYKLVEISKSTTP